MSIPSYSLPYQIQEDSRNFIKRVLPEWYDKLDVFLDILMKCVCSALYYFDPEHTSTPLETLITLSGMDEKQLSIFMFNKILDIDRKDKEPFIQSLIARIDIAGNGFLDGYEWTYVYFLQQLRRDEKLLNDGSTSTFYDYIVNVPYPFNDCEKCKDVYNLLSYIYPEGFDDLYYSLFDEICATSLTYKDWDTFCANLVESINRGTIEIVKDQVVVSENLGSDLLKFLVMISPLPTE